MTTEKKSGVRLDHWVKARFPQLNNRQISEAIEAGLVKSTRGAILTKGDRVFDSAAAIDTQALVRHVGELRRGNAALDFKVVFESAEEWIVDKPAGVASHPVSLFDLATVTHWAFARLPTLYTEFDELQPTITPHRLDTGTSGLLIVAKTRHAYGEWRSRFQRKQIKKKYRAWAWGIPEKTYYLNQNPLAHHPSAKSRMVTVRQRYAPPVMEARTEVLVLSARSSPDRFLCEVSCETGVTHQVRVHLADLGFPLVGDALYDPQYQSRHANPSFHQLRASEIHWETGSAVSDNSTFDNLEFE